MTDPHQPGIDQLRIDPAKKQRRGRHLGVILLTIVVCLVIAVLLPDQPLMAAYMSLFIIQGEALFH